MSADSRNSYSDTLCVVSLSCGEQAMHECAITLCVISSNGARHTNTTRVTAHNSAAHSREHRRPRTGRDVDETSDEQ